MLDSFVGVIKKKSRDAELLELIDPARVPAHMAVIMDGNGRWAKQRGKPRIFGHKAGAESVRAIVDTCARLGIKAVTLYAFSTENWKRPKDEVSGLMQMLKRFLKSELKEVHKNNIRFQAIGNLAGFSEDIQKELGAAMAKTADNTGMTLSIAINYGGRAEILQAAKKAAQQAIDRGDSIENMTDADIERNLYTYGLPEVDLMV